LRSARAVRPLFVLRSAPMVVVRSDERSVVVIVDEPVVPVVEPEAVLPVLLPVVPDAVLPVLPVVLPPAAVLPVVPPVEPAVLPVVPPVEPAVLPVPEPVVAPIEPEPEVPPGVPVVPIGVFCVLRWPAPVAGLAELVVGGALWATAVPTTATVAKPASRPLICCDAVIALTP
jgi:signal-induced proliferation-associated 1 like protein 3